MILFIEAFIILLTSLNLIQAEWRLIDSSFSEISIVDNNWKMKNSCSNGANGGYSVIRRTCSVNQLQYVRLQDEQQYLYKTFNYKSFQIQVIFDVFFDKANSNESQLKVYYRQDGSENTYDLYSREYDQDDVIQNSVYICKSSSSLFELQTVVSTIVTQNANKFTLEFCYNPNFEVEDDIYVKEIGIRNLLVFVNTCHPNCLTCQGPNQTDCLTCFDSQDTLEGRCYCISEQQFSETFIGCRQECSRDFSIARNDKICVNDNRIESKYSFFDDNDIPQSNDQRYTPLIFLDDKFHPKNADLVYESCNGKSFIGKMHFNEGMFYQMNLKNSESSKIEILHNNQLQSRIVKISSGFQFDNLIKIFQNEKNCDASYTLLRIEMIFKLSNSDPTILLQGQLQKDTESWGFRNITIDTGFCQQNCKVCSDFSNCAECETTYYLYKNKCVLSCPPHSFNCLDYDQIIPYSRYIAKGFYDLNMTIQEINNFYDSSPQPLINQATQQKFSFLNNKLVLGGLLVWNDGSYIKIWKIQQPHYAVSVYFNLTYGDGYSGSFYYKIGSTSSPYIGPFIKDGGGSNIIGRSDLESTSYFNIELTNFYSNDLYIEFKCEIEIPNITQEFCAISEYFIVAHYCVPFCTCCTNLNTCQIWETEHTNSNCENNQYLDFDQLTEIYDCKNCNQIGCSKCKSLDECTECVNNDFQLQNGICQCRPFTFFQDNNCIKCNKYCENCYGDSQDNCITCVNDFHRSIQRNQCICQPGYYDDGINLPCLPICGDLIIVDQEDCDDGNFNPYDGCDNCKFACNFNCDICLNGKCYQCKTEYELINNDCLQICQNTNLVLVQQCNHSSDNCKNCQYKCSDNCIICHFGICILCDEIMGWYAQEDGKCNTKCGDARVATLTEQCDDGNNNPYDGCNQCQFSCGMFCQTCINSQCLQCQEGYYLIQSNCYPQCNDKILVYPEQCENQNKQVLKGCFNCKFECQQSCLDCQFCICQKCKEGWYLQFDGSCQNICGDKILVPLIEECDNINNSIHVCSLCLQTCDVNCSSCYQGRCRACVQGYKLEQSIQKCIRICDVDSLVNYDEICNMLQNDSCGLCKYNCQNSCTQCTIFGCIECNSIGWKLNRQLHHCEPICGDGILIQNQEECDDLLETNCFQCKYFCQASCLICIQGNCLKCKQGWFLDLDKKCYPQIGDFLVVGDEQCDDNNFIMYDGCYLSQYQCQQSCIHCIMGQCNLCEVRYINFDERKMLKLDNKLSKLDYFNNKCLSICGDGYISYDEQCDDGNNDPYDGCHLCLFQCDNYCNSCFKGICTQCQFGYYLNKIKNQCLSFCGDGIIAHDEQCDDGYALVGQGCFNCKLYCQEQCTTCIDGQCFNCQQFGWQLNLIRRICQPICGDGIVTGNEQCDDGNDFDNDECISCYQKCEQQCTNCFQGFCYECDIEGWTLYQNQCIPICGDQLIIGNEQCDDGNLIPFDGCHECKFQCQSQCIDCQFGICYACQTEGWILDQNNLCSIFCGDGIVMRFYEECDDGNEEPYDGCYQCQYQCEQQCTQCHNGICQECDQQGWTISNNLCIPQCGDGLLVGNEQCDDMNIIQNDGCYDCKFECNQYCVDCIEGICNECQKGMVLIESLCQSFCGDGILINQFEQCDDGNTENRDGCNMKCEIEIDWVCISIIHSQSICEFERKPDFIINLLTPYSQEFQDIQIKFTQKVKLSSKVQNNLTQYIQTRIINSDRNKYNILDMKSADINQNISKDIVLSYRVTFFVSIELPIFEIEFFNDSIISELNQTLINNKKNIQLQTPIVLTQIQKQIAQVTSTFNEAIIISLVILSTICLLTGSSDVFWNLMDQLQYLSYIKYINIEFPSNLNIYFEVFNLISISPLISALGFDVLFNAIDGPTNYFVSTTNKFYKDDVNAYFFNNFSSIIFCIFTTYASYFSIQSICWLFYKLSENQVIILGMYISKNILKLRKKLRIQLSKFYYNGLLRLILSIQYDLCFACALQLAYTPKEENIILFLNYKLSQILFFFQILATFSIINIANAFSKCNSLKNRQKYQALFEGISENHNFWKMQYNTIQMIKKQIFISLIVFLQENSSIQAISIAFMQTIFFIYTILIKPFDNFQEFIKIIITESLIILNVLTFLFYHYKVEMSLTSDAVIYIGWFNIFMFSLILIVSFIVDIIHQCQKLIRFIKENFKQENKPSQPQFYVNEQNVSLNKRTIIVL
ncbi:unnamed protein product [Paramecium pentaurelia]|uniref:EGF-like domain-containing protein n=1 Tax=Paramecium pentaurelia TaxID=43138 RepID=A0A8S1V2M3_9CILI|nr:unnamed protein product [Paramecium pentaurelia]